MPCATAEEDAHDECAKQGKHAVIVDRQKHDSGLVSSAAATLYCVDPQYLVYTTTRNTSAALTLSSERRNFRGSPH